MSEIRNKNKHSREQDEILQGRVAIAYEGPTPDVFAGGALGGGLGAIIGFTVGGPIGAMVGGALGAAVGGWLGAMSEEERRRVGKS